MKPSFLLPYLRHPNPKNKAYSAYCLKIPREITTYSFGFFVSDFLNYFISFHRIPWYLKTTIKRVAQSSLSSYFALSQVSMSKLRQAVSQISDTARATRTKKLYQEKKRYLRQHHA